MEILLTLAYVFLIWLVFFKFKALKFNLFWGVLFFFLYGLAVLVEVVFLGQVVPKCNEAAVQGYAIVLQPKYPGYVENVFVKQGTPVKKGDPLFSMDSTTWKNKLIKNQAQLVQSTRLYEDAVRLTPSGAMAKQELLLRHAEVAKDQAAVDEAQFNLDHSTVYAPSDGFVPVVALKPGVYLGLINKRVMTFICTANLWITGKVRQQSAHLIKPGDKVEAAIHFYPGVIVYGEVIELVYGVGNTQLVPSGNLAKDWEFQPAKDYFVKIKIDKNSKHPLRYGAASTVIIYTKNAPDIFKVLRHIEIRAESFMNYLFNPF